MLCFNNSSIFDVHFGFLNKLVDICTYIASFKYMASCKQHYKRKLIFCDIQRTSGANKLKKCKFSPVVENT